MSDEVETEVSSMLAGRLVRLRPIEPSDLSFLARMTNDRHVTGLVAGWDFPVSIHDQTRWLDQISSDRAIRRLMVVGLDNELLGITGLYEIDWPNRHAIGPIKLYPPALRTKGIGTDVIMTLMAYAFYDVGLEKLQGPIIDFNGPSFGAYIGHCGWRIEGVFRRHVFRKGRFHDVYWISVLREEFDALPDAEEYVERIMPVDMSTKVEPAPDWWADRLTIT
jgi:RimJ/RimL family protein N-acetyltransferase